MKIQLQLADLAPQLTYEVKNYFYQMGGILLIINDHTEEFYPYHNILKVRVVKRQKD